jgi:hypothetical protein
VHDAIVASVGTPLAGASPAVAQIVEEVASEPLAAVFVGAGISTEAGLPSWSSLVRKLLEKVAPETEAFRDLAGAGDSAAAARLFAERTMSALGPLGAAAVAKAHLRDNYEADVSNALLADVELETLVPGPTALAIARFVIGRDPRPLVLTTNYDLLLERAFAAELRKREEPETLVVSLLPGDDLATDLYAIIHLHGLIDERKPIDARVRGELVLAEDEFFAAGEGGTKRRKLADAVLDQGRCLFLGTSLSDPNLLGYLYLAQRRSAGEKPRHATVAARQVSAGEQVDAFVLPALEETGERRLASAGVQVAFVSSYNDASQVVREIDLHSRARAAGRKKAYAEAPWRYDARVARFEQASLRAGLLPAREREAEFISAQERIRRVLERAVDAVKAGMAEVPAFQSKEEELAIHLWLFSPSTNLLILSAQSEKLSYNPAIIQAARATLPTSYLVVDAFCNGTAAEAGFPDLASGRWGSMLAVPVVHTDLAPRLDVPARLPGGVIVLASTAQGVQGLSRLKTRTQERKSLLAALAQLGEAVISSEVAKTPARTRKKFELLIPAGVKRERHKTGDEPPRLGSGTHISGALDDSTDLGRWAAIRNAVLDPQTGGRAAC